MIKQTHTYAVLDVSPAAHREVRSLLAAAGYGHAFHQDGGRELIDMHGIALAAGAGAEPIGADERRELEMYRELHARLAVATSCTSPDGGAEMGQVEQAYAERVRLPQALTVLFYVLMRECNLHQDELHTAIEGHVRPTVGIEPRFSNLQKQQAAEALANRFIRALARLID